MIIPYVDGGRDHGGVDCWGLIYLIFKEQFNIELPSHSNISANDLMSVHLQIEEGKSKWFPVQNPEKFDVALMNAKPNSKVISHIGLVLNKDRILHTSKRYGKPISEKIENLSSRIVGFYRYA